MNQVKAASAVTCQGEENWIVVEELTRQFPNVWCPVCEQVHQMLLVEKAANNHAAAVDLLCSQCWTVVATLHASRHGIGEDSGP